MANGQVKGQLSQRGSLKLTRITGEAERHSSKGNGRRWAWSAWKNRGCWYSYLYMQKCKIGRKEERCVTGQVMLAGEWTGTHCHELLHIGAHKFLFIKSISKKKSTSFHEGSQHAYGKRSMPFLITKVSELQDIKKSSLDLCYRKQNPAAPMITVCAVNRSLQTCHLTMDTEQAAQGSGHSPELPEFKESLDNALIIWSDFWMVLCRPRSGTWWSLRVPSNLGYSTILQGLERKKEQSQRREQRNERK